MSTLSITTKPGKKYRSLRRPRVYEALRRQGYSKQAAARISNAQARKKSYTLDQLEAFVSSSAYDPNTASLIALGIPELPRYKGEQIAPGITRIRGNLCNVHGKYGPCDKGLSGKKKPAKGRKPAAPKKTPAQQAAERDQKRQQNVADVAKRMADTDTGLSPAGVRELTAFAAGKQPEGAHGEGLAKMGLAERASDGSYRMTPTGRAVVSAMQAGDYQRAVDAISRGTDAQGKRTERQTAAQTRQEAARARQTEIATRRQAAEAKRLQREQERAQKKPAKAGGSGSKKPEQQAAEKPLKVRPTKRLARSSAPSVGGVGGGGSKPKPKPKPTPEKAPKPTREQTTGANRDKVRQGMAEADAALSPSGLDSLLSLAAGSEPNAAMATGLIELGMAERGSDGTLRLTSAARQVVAAANRGDTKAAIDAVSRAQEPKKTKETSFAVFKDATGRWRWVAQSSTAFQDRDKEIVSTKALADDCAFADAHGSYGPLRWWHTPGLDLGDCDFNAMHGRVLIESGTFKSEDIARKVAQAAPQLEISLGFLHLPSEPDAHGVFHHIRKFERSLVPRGKASNRFTAFTVKEIPMLDATKVAALKTLGFSDDDITNLQSQAQATEKAADAEKVAYKAEEPRTPGLHQGSASGEFAETGGIADLPDLVINGVTYKALPPSPPTAEDVVEEDAIGDMPMEEEATGGLTLSPEDLAAITEVFQTGLAQVMGALDLEKKVAGHVQGLLAPYTAQKDASDAEKAEQIQALQASLKAAQEQQEATQAKLDELLGLQPAVKAERATESTTTTINPWVPQDAQLLESIKGQVSPENQFAFGDLVENLFGNKPAGQA